MSKVKVEDVKVSEIYVVTNLDVLTSSSERCTMVYGRQVADMLRAFGWKHYEIREVGIPEPITREPTANEKAKK